MKSLVWSGRKLVVPALLAAGVLWGADLGFQVPDMDASVTVRAVMGSTGYCTDGTNYLAIKPGMMLVAGTELRTGPGAALELALAEPAGTLRLTENTGMILEQAGSGEGGAWKLDLKAGAVVGFDNHVAKPSLFQVKTPVGMVGVGASQYRIDARGYLVALEGLMIMALPAPDDTGKVQTEILQAPPSVYFAPGYGVQPSPRALVQEVLRQITTPLHGGVSRGSVVSSPVVEEQSVRKRPSKPMLLDPAMQPDRRTRRRY